MLTQTQPVKRETPVADSNDKLPKGYQKIPEEVQKKAGVFFEKAAGVSATGQWDFAIEMYVQGLNLDPDSVEAHKSLRDISLKRKATGGKPLGMMDKFKIKTSTKDDKLNMLNFEKLLAYDPGNTDYMIGMLQNALRGGFYDTVLWMGPVALRANADSGKPEFNKFIVIRDTYKALERWDLATEACQYAVAMKPDDMDLKTEMKHLAAQHTMARGNYATGKSFRESIRDMEGQKELMDKDSDVREEGQMAKLIKKAKAEYEADPKEAGKINKYVDILCKTDSADAENTAIDVLQKAYDETKAFRFRATIGQIVMRQLTRTERTLHAQVNASPTEENKAEYRQFAKEKAETELQEFQLAAENYPTDLRFKFEVANRLFMLSRFSDAIPIYQDARRDPKYKVEATIRLGQAFLKANFVDEAVDTLKAVIDEYQIKGDAKSMEMTYQYGLALEAKKDVPGALKQYSQVAQWDFNYKDVQARIKRLREGGGPA